MSIPESGSILPSPTSHRLPLFYCDHFELPLPPGHKFPLTKYRLLRDQLAGDRRFTLSPARPATEEAVLQVHGREYVDGFLTGTLEKQSIRRIGFPWSSGLVTRTLASAGSTLLATQAALTGGFGGTLAGGTHHAFRDEGSGFCVFNDIAIALTWARSTSPSLRATIIDLDVHQGDGTAAILGNDPNVFTLSVHGARNFPFRKEKSSLDVELPDGTADEPYLAALAPALDAAWRFQPQIIFYQAGVDPLATDRLGRLALSPHGLALRDARVIRGAYDRGVPLVITIGGGYSEPIEQTVEAHAQTFRTAADIYCA